MNLTAHFSWTRALRLALATATMSCGLSTAQAQDRQTKSEAPAFLGVRILKTEVGKELPWTVTLPSDCNACRLVINEYTSGQNSKEVFFHFLAPRALERIGPVHVRIDPAAVRGVLVGNTDYDLPAKRYVRVEARADGMARVEFHRDGDGITFDVPQRPNGVSLPRDDLADVTQNYTFIETPGVYIRIGHADPGRRRGAYATGPWPKIEAAAALNLEFATREAIVALGLDRTVPAKGAATIMLMNFDTNYPTLTPDNAHDDWPPHWHMHLLWKDAPRIRKVGHFYIGADGLMTQNQSGDLVTLSSDARANRWYLQGQADETRTPDGELLYSHTITPEGHFILSTPQGSCRMSPIAHGFESGVILRCGNGKPSVRVRAEDDIEAGRVRLFLNGRPAQDYRYDLDTGAIASTKAASN